MLKSAQRILCFVVLLIILSCQTKQKTTHDLKDITVSDLNADISRVSSDEYRCPSSALNQCQSLFKDEPISRFEDRLRLIQLRSAGKVKYVEIAEALNVEEVRRSALQLQALARTYEIGSKKKSDRELFAEFRAEVKEFEDQLGTYGRKNDLLKVAIEVKARATTIDYLTKQAELAQTTFVDFLKEKNWLPSPHKKINRLYKTLEDAHFKSIKKDKKLHAKALYDWAADVRKDLKTLDKIINQNEYSEPDLESGLHHMRRALRWITVTIQSSEAIYKYSEPSAEATAEQLDALKKYKDSKYVKLTSAFDNPILIDPIHIFVISKLVTEMGLLKDAKEAQIYLAESLLESKQARTEKEAVSMAAEILKPKWGKINVEKKTKELYAYYLRLDPLKGLLKDLERALEAD